MRHRILPGFESRLSFRPKSYWEHDDPVSAIVSNIKGTYRRKRITEILNAEGEEREMNALIPGLSSHQEFYEDDPGPELPAILAAIHPGLMGGEFLPGYDRGEAEIARIKLGSVTGDVISIRARRDRRHSRLLYRIVDEYPEYGDWKLTIRSSRKPLPFKRLVKLIDTAVSPLVNPDNSCGDLTDDLRAGTEFDNLDTAEGFVSVSSHFYPGLRGYYATKAEVWVEELRAEWEEDEDDEEED